MYFQVDNGESPKGAPLIQVKQEICTQLYFPFEKEFLTFAKKMKL